MKKEKRRKKRDGRKEKKVKDEEDERRKIEWKNWNEGFSPFYSLTIAEDWQGLKP